MHNPFRLKRPLLPGPGEFDASVMEGSLFWEATQELSRNIQVPPDMAGLTFLGALATACQGTHDVRMPYGNLKPLSLAINIIAPPGERKSALLNRVMSPINDMERQQRSEYAKKLELYQAEQSQWLAEKKALTEQIYRNKTKGSRTDKQSLELEELYERKPERPKEMAMVYEDATPEAVFKGLHEDFSSASVVTDEGHTAMKSALFRELGKLNTLWSGGTITTARATSGGVTLDNARLSIMMLVQPGVMQSHLEQHGQRERESGLWGRFLVCCPASLQGSRFMDAHHQVSWDAWEMARQRLASLVLENLVLTENVPHERRVLEFSAEAHECWVKVHNEIEAQLAFGERFFLVPDHANKLAENIARVAALLHLLEEDEEGGDEEGKIGIRSLRQAIELCSWYSNYFQQIFVPPPQEELDAQLLSEYLNEVRQYRYQVIRYNDVRQRGPNPIRNKKRLQAAIEVLMSHGEVDLFMQGKTKFINLYPQVQPIPSARGF
ncbi:YfjI family protein [Halomonas sp. IOP_31]|uniref:YfjI family protein n=1 Tax=Halomonas sp. IOP_31 TaxID=2876584 RepID=UPI001E62B44F|nr:YfjI family protein [Halomonas sp. IOP_31]MCD6007619.1 DUF3987 domain-containing protein [Halomonas sp. IOP_31]